MVQEKTRALTDEDLSEIKEITYPPGGGQMKNEGWKGYLSGTVNTGVYWKSNKLHYQIVRFFRYVRFRAKTDDLYRTISGQMGGNRRPWEITKVMLARGAVRGFPVVSVFINSRGCGALFIEIRGPGHVVQSRHTKKVMADLEARGYKVAVCNTWQEAVAILEDYIGRTPDEAAMLYAGTKKADNFPMEVG